MDIKINKLNTVPKTLNFKKLRGNKREGLYPSFGYNTESKDDKFSVKQSGKYFIKGALSPVLSVIRHPVQTIGFICAAAVICSLVPILTSVMTAGFLALGITQTVSGIKNVLCNAKNKQYDEAEKSFETIGQGISAAVLSLLGMKKSSQVIKEAKFMQEYNVNSLNPVEKDIIAFEAKNSTYMEALKENIGLYSKEGLSLITNQLKPKNVILRAEDTLKFLFGGKKKATYYEKNKVKFEDTEEYIKRSKETNEDIKQKAESVKNKVLDELGLEQELRPDIDIYNNIEEVEESGVLDKGEYKIGFNSASYKKGYSDLDESIAHEAFHSKNLMLRKTLSDEEVIEMIKGYLSDKIKSGDNDIVIKSVKKDEILFYKTPYTDNKLRREFSGFAEKYLYQTDKIYTKKELKPMITSLVKSLVEKDEELKKYKKTDKKAINSLTAYAQSIQSRFGFLREITEDAKTKGIKDCTKKELARKACMDELESYEATIVYTYNPSKCCDYDFCNEEVGAETFAKDFNIRTLSEKLKRMKSEKSENLREESEILLNILESKRIKKYLECGRELNIMYYGSKSEKYGILKELRYKLLQKRIESLMKKTIYKSYNGKEVSIMRYEPNEKMLRHQKGASVFVPYSAGHIASVKEDNKNP